MCVFFQIKCAPDQGATSQLSRDQRALLGEVASFLGYPSYEEQFGIALAVPRALGGPYQPTLGRPQNVAESNYPPARNE